jgi:hypothetical protein
LRELCICCANNFRGNTTLRSYHMSRTPMTDTRRKSDAGMRRAAWSWFRRQK